MKEQSKKGFLAKILENNREFDSTIGSIVTAMMMGKQVPDKMFEIVNVFENFILMILSYFFTRATAPTRRDEGAGNGPMNRDQGSQTK